MLRIQEIKFKNFRSYDDLLLENISNLTIFVGPNAVGKTNIVEGIGLLTGLSSFRHSSSKELIKNGECNSKISIIAADENRLLEISEMISPDHREYKLNNKKKRTKELKGLIPSVIFSPDDLQLIKSSNTIRRNTLDHLGSQLNSNYYQISKDYEKVIKHKNKLLKDEAADDLIFAIDELVVRVGSQLQNYRQGLFAKLLEQMKNLYKTITGSEENLGGTYTPSYINFLEKQTKGDSEPNADLTKTLSGYQQTTIDDIRQNMTSALELSHYDEMKRQRTLVGPHRDEILLTLDGLDSSVYASQGQQRSVVLTWKLAEAELIKQILGQLPILLLDDVMSELDETRRAALIDYLSDEIQTFITTANIDYFDEEMLKRATIIQLGL